MKNSLKLSIPSPCSENWHSMTKSEQGSFCQKCQENVIDFTAMTDAEILAFLSKGPKKICGRFNKEQINRELRAPKTVAWPKWITSSFLTVFTVGSLSAEHTRQIPTARFVQEISPEKDTLPPKLIEKNASSKKIPITLNGIVLDDLGDSIHLARVYIELTSGEKLLVLTDFEGRFSMQIPDSLYASHQTIYVSVIGYPLFQQQFLLTENLGNLTLQLSDPEVLGGLCVVEPKRRTVWSRIKSAFRKKKRHDHD